MQNYYDPIIRGESDLENIHDYILGNPRKWQKTKIFHADDLNSVRSVSAGF